MTIFHILLERLTYMGQRNMSRTLLKAFYLNHPSLELCNLVLNFPQAVS